MSDALFWHRLQFAFTVTYHYLFPQLTMGLALLIVILKDCRRCAPAPRATKTRRASGPKIFGLTFRRGRGDRHPARVPIWNQLVALLSHRRRRHRPDARHGGHVRLLPRVHDARALPLRGKLGARAHLAVAILLWLGSWLSGYFIIATNAFMQHPTGYAVAANGTLQLADFWAFVLNRWALWEYLHNMCAAVASPAPSSWQRSQRTGHFRVSTRNKLEAQSSPQHRRRPDRVRAARSSRREIARERWSPTISPLRARLDGGPSITGARERRSRSSASPIRRGASSKIRSSCRPR